MIFNTITKFKQGVVFDIIICVLIYSFVFTINGCVTSETSQVTNEKLPFEKDYEIVRVLMKNGTVIHLEGRQARFFGDYKDHKNIILYYENDYSKNSKYTTKTVYKEKIIDLKDVSSVTVEKSEINVGLTVLAGVLVVAGIIVIIIVAANSGSDETHNSPNPDTIKFKGSCPYVYTYNGNGFKIESETFSGAIVKTAERYAFDNLNHLQPVDGKLILKLTNEMPEIQYTNELKVVAADTKKNEKVITDYTGKLHTISSPILPYSCTDLSGKDMKNLVMNNDDKLWESDLINMDMSKVENLKDGLILEFNKPANASTAKLVVGGVNTDLTIAALHELLRIKGRKKSEWMQNVENNPKETQRFLKFFKREGMLHIKLWINDQWVEQNIIPDPGPTVSKEQVVLLDISQISGETLRVKLETTTDLWKINHVYVDYSKDDDITSNELNVSTAINQKGENVKDVLNFDDNKYLVTVNGDYAIVSYEDIPLCAGMYRHYILKSKGYYHPLFQSNENENVELYNKILDEPLFGAKYFMSQWKEERFNKK